MRRVHTRAIYFPPKYERGWHAEITPSFVQPINFSMRDTPSITEFVPYKRANRYSNPIIPEYNNDSPFFGERWKEALKQSAINAPYNHDYAVQQITKTHDIAEHKKRLFQQLHAQRGRDIPRSSVNRANEEAMRAALAESFEDAKLKKTKKEAAASRVYEEATQGNKVLPPDSAAVPSAVLSGDDATGSLVVPLTRGELEDPSDIIDKQRKIQEGVAQQVDKTFKEEHGIENPNPTEVSSTAAPVSTSRPNAPNAVLGR